MFANLPYLEGRLLRRHALSRRGRIVAHALYSVHHSAQTFPGYTEDVKVRAQFLAKPRGTYPVDTDCSGHLTWCYWMSDAPDPNGLSYKQLGFTGTIVTHAHTVTTDLRKARPGDPIVVGLQEEGGVNVGVHVYTVVRAGKNPLCASHGSPGVQLVRVLNDPRRPRRVCVSL